MKRFLSACLLFVLLPSLASADSWAWQCDGSVCRRVLVRTAPTIVVAATPAEYVSFAPVAPVTVSTANYQSFAPPEPAAPLATTCNCAVTGICSCDPATCACASCLNGQARMAASVQYVSGRSYYSVQAPTVMYAAPPVVSTARDPFGNVFIQQNYRGAYARQVYRHTVRGVRLGIN